MSDMRKIDIGDIAIQPNTGNRVIVESKEWSQNTKRWKWVLISNSSRTGEKFGGIKGSVWTIDDNLESVGYKIDVQHYREEKINELLDKNK